MNTYCHGQLHHHSYMLIADMYTQQAEHAPGRSMPHHLHISSCRQKHDKRAH